MILAFAKFLRRMAERIESRYCCVCGDNLVLYKDGHWDCRHIVQSEITRRGGLA
jgi:hypothetical protein